MKLKTQTSKNQLQTEPSILKGDEGAVTVSATLLTSNIHTHTVCPQLSGPQVHPWVLRPRWGKVQQPCRGPSPPPSPTANHHIRALLVPAGLGLLGQAADGQVVNHLLDFLHVVLEAVVALPQGVVLQVEQAEAGVQLVDEVGDAQRSGVVSCCDAVYRQPWLEEDTTATIKH